MWRVFERALLLMLCNRHPTVLAEFPHDSEAFTQGLVYDGSSSAFYESTGLYGRSSVRQVDPATGEVFSQRTLASTYFGEGLALWNGTLFQLTWREEVALTYEASSDLTEGPAYQYSTEGWGLALVSENDPSQDRLAMTDGSSTVRFMDPRSFQENVDQRIIIRDQDTEVTNLNELEMVNGYLWSNVWLTPYIAIINITQGLVVMWLNLVNLVEAVKTEFPSANVLNGVAFDAENQRIWVTGKLWPKVFELNLVEIMAALESTSVANNTYIKPWESSDLLDTSLSPTLHSADVPLLESPTIATNSPLLDRDVPDVVTSPPSWVGNKKNPPTSLETAPPESNQISGGFALSSVSNGDKIWYTVVSKMVWVPVMNILLGWARD